MKIMRNCMIVSMVIVLLILVFTGCGGKNALVGTWEERSYDYGYTSGRIEEGHGDKLIFSKDGKVIDEDAFNSYTGYEGEATSYEIIEGKLALYDSDGDPTYYDYSINGKDLTLVYRSETYVFRKIK